MNALPYYPRYPRDFFEGTAGMSLEEKGAYGLVLDLIYMMGARGLPDDSQYIAGQLGTSVRKWNSLKKSLIERGKLHAVDGIISNKRADKVKKKQRTYQDNQAENGRSANKNNDLPEPSPTDREEPNTDTYKIDDDSAGDALLFREKVCLAAGHDASGVMGNSKIFANRGEFSEFQGWMRDLELSEAQVLDAIADTMQAKQGGPPTSLRYFKSSLQSHAGKVNAARITATDPKPSQQSSLGYRVPRPDFPAEHETEYNQ